MFSRISAFQQKIRMTCGSSPFVTMASVWIQPFLIRFIIFQRLHTREKYSGTGVWTGYREEDHRTARRTDLGGVGGGEGIDVLLYPAGKWGGKY